MAEGRGDLGKVSSAAFSLKGGRLKDRIEGLSALMKILREARKDLYGSESDPLARARLGLKKQADEVARIHEEEDQNIGKAVESALWRED